VKTHFSNYKPDNSMAARLSVPYCVAVCAAKRDAGLDAFHPETIFDPVVQETLKKIEIVADPELNKLYPEKFPSAIEIETKEGKLYKGEMYYPRGSAKNAFTGEEVNEKFMSLALPIMEKERAAQITQVIDSLEKVKDVNELTNLLV